MKQKIVWNWKKKTISSWLNIFFILVVLILPGCSSRPQKLILPFTRNEIKEIRIVDLNLKQEVIVDDEFDQLADMLVGLSGLNGEVVSRITEPYYLLLVKHEVGEELIYLSGIRELILSKKKYRTEPHEVLFDLADTIYKSKTRPEPVLHDPADFQNVFQSTYLTIPDDYDWEALLKSGLTSFSEGVHCSYVYIFVSEFHEMLEYCHLTTEVIDKNNEMFDSIIDQISGTREILAQLRKKILIHVPHQENKKRQQLSLN